MARGADPSFFLSIFIDRGAREVNSFVILPIERSSRYTGSGKAPTNTKKPK